MNYFGSYNVGIEKMGDIIEQKKQQEVVNFYKFRGAGLKTDKTF